MVWGVTAPQTTQFYKEIKNLFVFAIVVVLTIFNGCQKDETIGQLADEKQQTVILNVMFAGLDTIGFSIENNHLVFDNEKEYQKCINFLAQLGDENFPAFEKEIGFDSYRKTFDDNPLKSKLFVNELYQTMLNPDMEIIVGDYLLRENPDAQLTYAFELDKESICNLKSSLLTIPTYTFSWNDNAFAIIEGTEESNLKSTQINYCNVRRDNHRNFIIKSSNWHLERSYSDPYAYNVKLEAKLCFQNTAGFKSIISKIRLVSASYDCLDEWDILVMTLCMQNFTLKVLMM